MLTTHNAMHPQAEVDRLWLSEVQACVPPPPTPTASAHLPFVFGKAANGSRWGRALIQKSHGGA